MIEKIKYYVRNMTRTPDITRQDQEVANLVRSDIYTDYATHVAAYRIAIEKAYSGELATLKAQRDELLAAAKNAALDLRGTPDGIALEAAISNAERPAGC